MTMRGMTVKRSQEGHHEIGCSRHPEEYQRYVQRQGRAPVLFLYDVTSSYLEGEHNELAQYGYNGMAKRARNRLWWGC